ncbi:MAG TPA: alkaline phosphatase family protein [Planctomycetaceae bacterium]|nr:alkaline phosphatase family protein [Planctomycetaceae bacterium]
MKIETWPLRNGILALLLTLIVVAGADLARCAADQPRKTKNVVVITYDGLRWQEVFSGCDETLLNKDQGGGVRDVPAIKARFWRDTPEERREALLPFFWKIIAQKGQVFGDPAHRCRARVTNGRNFSYPGYNELLAGFADDRIDSNAKKENPNVTVLEWLNRRPGFAGRVAAFCSWDTFPWIINHARSGIPINAGWSTFDTGPDPVRLAALNDAIRDTTHVWENVRDDALTFHGAIEYVKAKKPRVLYISFGETDDWAHEGRYDLVLDAARRTDGFIERLWDTLQSLPEYAAQTSLVLTTDHGRGDTRIEWKNHGKDTAGSDQMWIAVMGPDTPAAGCRSDLDVTQSQTAATIAALLGEDYHAAVSKSAAPLPGIVMAGSGQ